MSDTSHRVQAVIDRFVTELATIAREEAARVILDGIAPLARSLKAPSNGAARVGKRSPESLQALEGKLLGFVKAHPGMRIEQINAELGTSTKDLALPIRKLVASKQVKTQGARRATKYFAGGGGAKGDEKNKQSKR